jgi:hypothetical protein
MSNLYNKNYDNDIKFYYDHMLMINEAIKEGNAVIISKANHLGRESDFVFELTLVPQNVKFRPIEIKKGDNLFYDFDNFLKVLKIINEGNSAGVGLGEYGIVVKEIQKEN